MLLYDVTNGSSFDNIRSWIRDVKEVSLIMAQFQHIIMPRWAEPRGIQ